MKFSMCYILEKDAYNKRFEYNSNRMKKTYKKQRGKKKRNAYSNKAQKSQLFLRKLHVIGTTIYGIKVQLRSFNICLFPGTQYKHVSHTEYSWHRYYPANIY